jgi:hypothetical protein
VQVPGLTGISCMEINLRYKIGNWDWNVVGVPVFIAVRLIKVKSIFDFSKFLTDQFNNKIPANEIVRSY